MTMYGSIARAASEFIEAHEAQGPEPKEWPATVPCKCGAQISGVNKDCLVRMFVHHIVMTLMLERAEP